ncbi:MAG: biotin--[acetyl-CoA-carboxylase] ligase, partial [Bacteroidetes bacterium]
IPNPTSLRLECGRALELEPVLHTLLAHLETRYLQLKAGRLNELLLDYYSRLYRFQEEALYRDRQGRLFRGCITGVSPQGKLLIATSEGERAFANKEIEFL